MSDHPIKKFTDKNRIAWEEVNSYHQQAKQHIKERFRSEPGFLALDPHLQARLSELTITGKSVLHMMCNDGEELISAKRMGAGRCFGVDISSTAIESAITLADQLKQDVQFKQSDAYDVDLSMLGEPFDLAMTTIGALCWLPDLPLFFRRLNSFLKSDASLLIHEIHPFVYLLNDDLQISQDADYFDETPIVEKGDLDYLGHNEYDGAENVEFSLTFSRIITSLLAAGFSLCAIYEYPDDHGNLFNREAGSTPALPLSFSIIAEKTASC